MGAGWTPSPPDGMLTFASNQEIRASACEQESSPRRASRAPPAPRVPLPRVGSWGGSHSRPCSAREGRPIPVLSPAPCHSPRCAGAELHLKGLGPARPPEGEPHVVPLGVGQRLEEGEAVSVAGGQSPHCPCLPWVSWTNLGARQGLPPEQRRGGAQAVGCAIDQQPGPEPTDSAPQSSGEGTGHVA